MNKETANAIDFIFNSALDIYNGVNIRDSVINKIHIQFGTNKSSCNMYIRNITCMIKGEIYKINMSSSATDDLLRNFYVYENGKYFKNSISALEQFIHHNENVKNKTMHKLRKVLTKWSNRK